MLKDLLPPTARARLRQLLVDLPVVIRDAPGDVWGRWVNPGPPVPPARLRRRVARTSSRDQFLSIGKRCANDVLAALRSAGHHASVNAQWLDFGCGCGRLGRHLATSVSVTGVDIDTAQIGWAASHLPGRWLTIAAEPPLPFPERTFDVVFSVSVFTHLDEPMQLRWLAELQRVLRSGGVFLATTHGPRLAELLAPQFALNPEEVDSAGFVHLPSQRGFNHQVSFHSPAYLRSRWSEFFRLMSYLPAGLDGYQDISVWAA